MDAWGGPPMMCWAPPMMGWGMDPYMMKGGKSMGGKSMGKAGKAGKDCKGGGAGKKTDGPQNRVFVGGLPHKPNGDAIREFFEQFGTILDVKMLYHEDSGVSKGYCFVDFEDESAAQQVFDNYENNMVDGKWVDCKRSSGDTPGPKPGDWFCPCCGDLVFAKRSSCYVCGYPDGGGKGGCMKGMSKGSKGGGRDSSPMGQKGGGRREVREGDWECPSCGDLVFSYRGSCNKCDTPKPSSERQSSKQEGRSGRQQQAKPGDWNCPGCGDLVFASKKECSLCRTPKPRE